ncbi:Citrate/oxoglutarate carrier protein [Hondaea fermentalgiana]|uniref:Citrate/oxoglutarate carrier protein n=1 Tax=Hondaea fermentalgiana TaxID=2315210 RepID=A0A2R5GH52_9STRA|nr:Citrate/oxoglutarate carrier protein [Hondaea fermentalgiana]|eukprot:GBG27184.1 Citrate/oxoglutarate carrier protein [Hondaea fermentalgiana]
MARSEAATAAATGGVASLCSVKALSGAGDAGGKGSGALLNLGIGAGIQCLEAASLGMPFEVWKTRMGRYRHESTVESFVNVYKTGGARAFWAGLGPKMVESATKGAILMASKEAINESLLASGVGPTASGLLAGAGGGVCQVVVMGPCTFLVTGAVTGDKSMSTMERVRRTYTRSGIRGFYPGASAIAFRQATNWASRQGFTEFARGQIKTLVHGDAADAKLTPLQEVAAGIIGGTMACWNHPFEVARIEMQARGDQGQKSINLAQTLRLVVQEHGVGGLFKGIVPRICLGVYQTLFMVTGAKLIKDELRRAGVL